MNEETIKEVKVIIENKLVLEKRAINVYHHSTRSAHMISHNSSITLPLKNHADDDYLHISIISGPGVLKNQSIVELPSWTNFEFFVDGNVSVTHLDDRTRIKVPAGLPEWQLKVTRAHQPLAFRMDRVIIGDEQLEYR